MFLAWLTVFSLNSAYSTNEFLPWYCCIVNQNNPQQIIICHMSSIMSWPFAHSGIRNEQQVSSHSITITHILVCSADALKQTRLSHFSAACISIVLLLIFQHFQVLFPDHEDHFFVLFRHGYQDMFAFADKLGKMESSFCTKCFHIFHQGGSYFFIFY